MKYKFTYVTITNNHSMSLVNRQVYSKESMVFCFSFYPLSEGEMDKNIIKGVGKIIRFERVTKRFDDGTKALKNISVEIPTNKLTVIIGPSGCGKTTFMKMINRLESPTDGEIYI